MTYSEKEWQEHIENNCLDEELDDVWEDWPDDSEDIEDDSEDIDNDCSQYPKEDFDEDNDDSFNSCKYYRHYWDEDILTPEEILGVII